MRKEKWSDQEVYYKLKLNDQVIRDDFEKGYACYGNIRDEIITKDHILILRNFHQPETEKFIVDYVIKLSKIFDIKIKFINDDELEITNFRSSFYLFLFCILFRFLFENGAKNGSELAVNLIETFINDKRKKDLLYKFTDSYNKVNFIMGNTGHGICNGGNILLRTKKQLREYDLKKDKGYTPVYTFFMKN